MKNFLLLKIFSKFIKLLNLEQDSQTVVNCILSGQLYLMFKPYLIAPFVLFFTCRPENVMLVHICDHCGEIIFISGQCSSVQLASK